MKGRTVLGKYRVGQSIGRGSMGEVFLAKPLAGGPDVVVKFMNDRSLNEARHREQFARELEVMARFRHPHAVQLLGGATDDPAGPCIVMEYVPGLELGEVLAVCKRFDAERLARLLLPLCQALNAAHSAGIVHRDLKPANLRVINPGYENESIKVMDLGLAALANKPYIPLEKLQGEYEAYVVGSPAYICPEQVRGDDVDGRGDIYSLGVVMYEMLAGRLPFEDEDLMTLLDAQVSRTPPKFAELGLTDISPRVEAVVRHCLEKYPNERPQTPFDLAKNYLAALGCDVTLDRKDFAPAVAAGGGKSNAPPKSDHERIVENLEAWMPEPIAAVKLRGYFEDQGAKVLSSEPGLIRVQLGEVTQTAPQRGGILGWLNRTPTPVVREQLAPVAIDLYLAKKPGGANRLEVTAVFRGLHGTLPNDTRWHQRVAKLLKELRSYLMVQA